MMQVRLIETALLLGLYVLLAGAYALAYTIAKLKNNFAFKSAAYAFYGLHVCVMTGVIFWAPIGAGWKTLLVASSLAILAIPPVTWRYLEHTHGTGRASA
jgi:hypothetical protein